MFGRKTLLAGLAAATFATGALAMPAAAAASTRAPVVYQYAWGHAHVRPHYLAFGGTSNVLLKFRSWNRWGSHRATTTHATLWVNQCQPNCARGKYRKYPATAALSRVRRHHGRPYFTRLRFTLKRTGKTLRARFTTLWFIS
jgi:hypothetical protein